MGQALFWWHRAVPDRPQVEGQPVLQRVLPRRQWGRAGGDHQTGWTGVIADIIRRRHGDVGSVGEVLRMVAGRRAEK